MKRKAVVLMSGGLDSTLAAKMMLDMGIQVSAINFVMPFQLPNTGKTESQNDAIKSAHNLGIELKTVHLGLDYMEMVRKPAHGYGKAINPCVDCHIFFLKKAGEYMRESGADFLVTGEVLGQRPMSQKRDSMILIERESGLSGLILRPLSAQHFDPTIPEQNGWVDRSRLLAIKGRSRQDQFQLAAKTGIKEYPNPAGGCLLTETSFAPKLKDVFAHTKELDMREFQMLRIGRHFRIGEQTKVIIGRDESDNALLESTIRPGDTCFSWLDGNTPLGIIVGMYDENQLLLAMQLLLRYTKAGAGAPCRVNLRCGVDESTRTVTNSITEDTVAAYRID